MIYFFSAIFFPSTTDHIGLFYFFWMLSFIVTNVVWDILSTITGRFHVGKMTEKTPVVYNAATFCTSLLLLLAVFEPEARKLAGDNFIPFALAGFSGIAQSIAAICPYNVKEFVLSDQPALVSDEKRVKSFEG